VGRAILPEVSTLKEIERAAVNLPREEQRELAFFLLGRLRVGERKSRPSGFLQRWGGSLKKIEDADDPWLTHINRKHLP
jgi:hypothetical protein